MIYYSRKQKSVNGEGEENMAKLRKTLVFFLIPLIFYGLGVGSILIFGARETAFPVELTGERERSFPATAEELRVDLNKVSFEELCTFPNVGEVMAQKILDYRQQQGGFRTIEELKKIKGIGNKLFSQLRDYVYVEE
jgi:competence protein ComEA